MKYTTFIWDFDGTLFDSYPYTASVFGSVMERDGIEFKLEDVTRALHVGFAECKSQYALNDEQFKEILNRSIRISPMVTPFRDAAAVLRAICESCGKNYLYTHRDRSAWTYFRLFGLDKYFVGGVDATMGFLSKPAPDAIEHICRVYSIDPASAVMIGDREIDVLAGVNAGCAGCLFMSHPVVDVPANEKTCASHTADSMRALAKELDIPLNEADILSDADAQKLRDEASAAALELCKEAKLKAGDLVVIGCSTSEITGERIGSSSTPEAADAVLAGFTEVFAPRGINIAAQCCEHLNRALIVERALATSRGYEIMNVIPMPKAGGAFANALWRTLNEPVAVSEIKADAGLDIGGTLIGMHLKRVAVPLRLSVKAIGKAPLSAARVRPPFTGGERAVYDESVM